ncbi:hypothetical protein F2Q70_00043676 [Brassica cretica]|uniref:Uncharacterized protein n=1 Tax=Brassica cretica TaxID=69181 RepID=A0A8S9KKB7_BRACR|nr:hypothetical protein F2Q70_00043676 [Brassica cretica]
MDDLYDLWGVGYNSEIPENVMPGLELHWMRDRPVGGRDAEKSAIWRFSRRTVLKVVPDRAEHPECMFQRQRFFRKFPNISGFYLGLSPFTLRPP